MSEGISDDEEEDSDDENLGDASSDTQGTRREQRQFTIMVNAIAGLCYARNQCANYLQMNVRYWLYAAGAPKGVRETKDHINHNTRTSDDHFTHEV